MKDANNETAISKTLWMNMEKSLKHQKIKEEVGIMVDYKENNAVKVTTDKAVRKNIYFFDEKKWIMAYWFKTMGRRKAQYTVKYLREQWIKWWRNDSECISDEMLQDILVWLRDIVRPMSKDEVKKKRRGAANKSPVLPFLKRLAEKKGYYIKKCSTRNHPLKVSGYAIFKNREDKVPVYGKKFDLTVKQTKKILESKEDK